MPVIGKNMISWFYAYVEHIEIKTKPVNIIHFPYLDLSHNVKIRDVPYSLKSPRNSECKLAHIYGMNKGKVFIPCVSGVSIYKSIFLIHVLKEQLGDILFIAFVIASGEAIIIYFE
jgi:hypothetical protein